MQRTAQPGRTTKKDETNQKKKKKRCLLLVALAAASQLLTHPLPPGNSEVRNARRCSIQHQHKARRPGPGDATPDDKDV